MKSLPKGLILSLGIFLLLLESGSRSNATSPGTNGRISFARFFPVTNSFSIFSIRPDGTGEQQLTFDAANHASIVSDWSPDGSRIAFDSDRFSNTTDDFLDIFTMNADGSSCCVQLTTHVGFNGEPEYSPDGNTIVFESDRGVSGGEGIYLMNASNGMNVRRLTATPAGSVDVFPHFSPAGNQIVFTRAHFCRPNRGTNGVGGCLAAAFLVNLDGSGLTPITPWGHDTLATDWSSDGSKLALQSPFFTNLGRKTNVLIVDVDGSNPVNLTNNPPLNAAPFPCSISAGATFSPDSTKLVFGHTDCSGHPTLWIMNADGSGKQDTGIQLGPSNFTGFADWGTNLK
jgi:Tol biopolymer transport system component